MCGVCGACVCVVCMCVVCVWCVCVVCVVFVVRVCVCVCVWCVFGVCVICSVRVCVWCGVCVCGARACVRVCTFHAQKPTTHSGFRFTKQNFASHNVHSINSVRGHTYVMQGKTETI